MSHLSSPIQQTFIDTCSGLSTVLCPGDTAGKEDSTVDEREEQTTQILRKLTTSVKHLPRVKERKGRPRLGGAEGI